MHFEYNTFLPSDHLLGLKRRKLKKQKWVPDNTLRIFGIVKDQGIHALIFQALKSANDNIGAN